MKDATVDGCARAIAEAHRTRAPYALLSADRIGDLAFAYAVQDRLVGGWRAEGEGALAGWKLGLTYPEIQAAAGAVEPISGALLERRAKSTGALLAAADYVHLGLEGEIAVRVKAAFLETEPVSPAVTASRLDLVAAALEVTDDRNADWTRHLEATSLVADNIWNMGMVIGPTTPLDAYGSLFGRRGVVTVNGTLLDQGMSQDAGGDPLDIVAWLGAHLAQRGQPLQPGQWIMTGSFVPTRFPRPGDHHRFEVDGLEAVEVRIA
jgi:2-oxo-3-hexenedioate decarboxylase/2-keto-4-pentenoate hydratase